MHDIAPVTSYNPHKSIMCAVKPSGHNYGDCSHDFIHYNYRAFVKTLRLQYMQYADYGVDWEGPTPVDENSNTVDVPETEGLLNQEEQEKLREILQNESGNDFEEDMSLIEQYMVAKHFIQERLLARNQYSPILHD